MYPFVQFEESHKGRKPTLFISDKDYCEIIYFVQESDMASLYFRSLFGLFIYLFKIYCSLSVKTYLMASELRKVLL